MHLFCISFSEACSIRLRPFLPSSLQIWIKIYFAKSNSSFIKKETLAQVFHCKKTFFMEYLLWLLLSIITSLKIENNKSKNETEKKFTLHASVHWTKEKKATAWTLLIFFFFLKFNRCYYWVPLSITNDGNVTLTKNQLTLPFLRQDQPKRLKYVQANTMWCLIQVNRRLTLTFSLEESKKQLSPGLLLHV